MPRCRPLLRALATSATVLLLLWASSSPSTAAPVGALHIESGAAALSLDGINFTTISSTGNFVGLSSTLSNTADLSFAAPAVGNFITFQAAPTQAINVTGLGPAAFSSANCFAAPAVGQTCTPPAGSVPLNFANTSTGVVASFSVQGTAVSLTTPTAITGVYTLQLPGTNYQSVLQTLAAGGIVRTTYSAEFSGASGKFTVGGSLALSSAGIDFAPTSLIGTPNLPFDAFLVGTPSTGTFQALAGASGIAADSSTRRRRRAIWSTSPTS